VIWIVDEVKSIGEAKAESSLLVAATSFPRIPVADLLTPNIRLGPKRGILFDVLLPDDYTYLRITSSRTR
jgi:hypothetical protein